MLSPNSNPEPRKPAPCPEMSATANPASMVTSLKVPKLNLGRIVITSNALSVLAMDEVNAALRRHQAGDWGNVCAEDWKSNDRSCRDLGMVLSVYESAKGIRFYVITDPDHEISTVLLPEDY